MKVKSESEVAQSYLTLSDPMDHSLPGSSIHRIFFPGKSTGVGCHCLLPPLVQPLSKKWKLSVGEDVEKWGPLRTADGECEMVQPLGKTVWRFLKK